MNVSDNIKAIRNSKGLSQAEVARRYNTSPEFYHRLEKKGQSLTLEQVEKLAQALEVSIAELLGLEVIEDGNAPNTLQDRVNSLEKENFDLKAENKMYQKHNKILFDNIEFLQGTINSLTSNQQRLDQFKQVITGGNPDVEEQIKLAADKLFPDLAKRFETPQVKKANDSE